MAIYITDENGKPKKVAGNCGLDPRLASKDLVNVTYPTIVYDKDSGEFDGIPHTGAGDRVVERYLSSDGKSWYEIYASGWKRCGGIYKISEVTDSLNIVFPNITFKNENYCFYTQMFQGSAQTSTNNPTYQYLFRALRNVVTKNLDSITIQSVTQAFMWRAEGY